MLHDLPLQRSCELIPALIRKQRQACGLTRSYSTITGVRVAWRKSGICPLNPNIFTAADFAPSYTTPTMFHTPSTYPTSVPDFSDAPPPNDTYYQPPRGDPQSERGSDTDSDDSHSSSGSYLDLNSDIGDYSDSARPEEEVETGDREVAAGGRSWDAAQPERFHNGMLSDRITLLSF